MTKSKALISFLITHYNRPSDLLECIEAIKKINLSNYEIVVSDDGSKKDIIKQIQAYSIDRLILSDINNGLAANINKGIKACEGTFIIYCQEDFILSPTIKELLPECLELLNTKKADLIRFTSNFQFNKLINLSENISSIPKFSFKNFQYNYYQYSDHPFITKRSFYDTFGYYLENTSGRYGETEFAIRICNSKAKIAITNKTLASLVVGSESVLINENNVQHKEYKVNKSFLKTARALRLYFEWVFYRKNKRGLISYKNGREKQVNTNA